MSTPSQKENGPAWIALQPSRGSSIPQKGKPMNVHTDTTGTPENLDRPDIADTLDVLNRAWSQIELINMAAEAGNVTGHAGNAIAWGCIGVQELLKQVKEHLEPRVQVLAKGSVGHVLSGMLDAYQATIDKINQTDGDATEEDIQPMLDAALSIIGYRALTKGDERRKAEFLREYTQATLLTEREQTALVASLQPERAAS